MTIKEKIKARLKHLWPKANLSTTRIDEISDKLSKKLTDDSDDAAVDGVLNDANDLMDFEATAKNDDRLRTLEKKAKEGDDKGNGDDDKKDDDDKSDKSNDQANPNKELLEAIKGLKDEIKEIKTGKITETKQAAAQAAFEKSEILKGLKPEIKQSWLNRIDVNSETTLEDQLKVLETEYTDLTQDFANSQSYAGPTPRGGGDLKPSDDVVNEIVGNLMQS